MDKLISQQAAIDVVAKWIFEVFGIKESDGTATVFKRLRELPSAEPDTTTHGSNVVKKGKNDGDRTSGDCISRTQAVDVLEKMQTYKLFAGDDMLLIDQAEAQTELMGLPSVQPERKTGHWVYRPEWSKYGDVWSCSECGEKTSQSVMGEPRFKYCPMCGAKMESVGEQE